MSVGVFDAFSGRDKDEVPHFAVTTVAVSIAQAGSEFVTRSTARQLLEGKTQFDTILLDFTGVAGIGQGFADEVFRVFPSENPEVTISPINMNEAVSWFVDRAQAESLRDYPE